MSLPLRKQCSAKFGLRLASNQISWNHYNQAMRPATTSPVAQLMEAYRRGEIDPASTARAALARANSNAGHNTYLAMDPEGVLAEAAALPQKFPDPARWPLLYGVPVSLKDCFDLAGFATSGGSRFYAERNGIAAQDSAVAERLRRAGAILVGKTHLHPLAYGITGENPDYGDCLQPRNAAWLTGGSSSGAAASIQEGSALAAIGTDTGGSVRTPAALCGLAGYRASHGLAERMGLWRGAMHLAQSFDTPGWLFQSAADAPRLGAALLDLEIPPSVGMDVRIGVVSDAFLHDCEPRVLAMYRRMQARLQEAGAQFAEIDTEFWSGAMEIFAPIQAAEAAAIHRGNYAHFPAEIADRLQWGEGLSAAELDPLRVRHQEFRARIDACFAQSFDFLLVPCAPMADLPAGADHSNTRPRILRYTIPFSLGGNPVVALPGDVGGVQLVAARGDDARLLRYAAQTAQ
jgi:aspartyl-tRNA(Asn)/glutamyl-tRNA(Gln) amidotransferase subunit A